MNEQQLLDANKEHESFIENFYKGICYICNQGLDSYTKVSPCLHWLLNPKRTGKPKGVKKKDIIRMLDSFEYTRISAYLRWVANTRPKDFAKNINNISDDPNKYIDITIRWNQFTWSFESKKSDFNGHKGQGQGGAPHYHFQMKIGRNNTFIKFNDSHLPLTKEEQFFIKQAHENSENIKLACFHGEGIADLLENEYYIQQVLNPPKHSETKELNGSPIRISSLIISNEQSSLDGDKILRTIKKAKEMGVPAASLLAESTEWETKISVHPSENVIDKHSRTKRKKKSGTKSIVKKNDEDPEEK